MINKVNSPQLLGTRESQIAPSCVNEFFKSVHLFIVALSLYLQYYVAVALNACTPSPKIFFEGIIQSSRNMGIKGDIKTYKMHRKFNPFFGDGYCFGGSLVFIKSLFQKGGDIEKTALKFKQGIPFEGIILQDAYDQMFDKVEARFGGVTVQNAVDYIQTPMFKALGMNGQTIEPSESPENGVEIIKGLKPGVFLLNIPTYSSFGNTEDNHAVVLIKTENDSFVFDPNVGIGKSTNDSGERIIKRLFSCYVGKLGFEKIPQTLKEKVSYTFRYALNAMRGHMNPPFMKKIKEGCQIIKVAPL